MKVLLVESALPGGGNVYVCIAATMCTNAVRDGEFLLFAHTKTSPNNSAQISTYRGNSKLEFNDQLTQLINPSQPNEDIV